MKYLVVSIAFILVTFYGQAQSVNTQNIHNTQNEWVDYTKTYYKIKVAENGVYKLSFQTLEKGGFPIGSTKGNQLLLINEGKEVPVFVSNSEQWTNNDYLEFYGEQLDGTFDTQLYEEPEHQLHTYLSMFTDTAAYYLTIGLPEERIKLVENNFENLPEKEDYFMHEAFYAPFDDISSGKPNGKHPHIHHPDYIPPRLSNVYFGNYNQGEGYFANYILNRPPISPNPFLLEIETPSVFSNGPTAQLKFKVIGLNDEDDRKLDHYLQIKMNDKLLVEDAFDSYSIKTYQVEQPILENLNNTKNTFEFYSATDTAYRDRMGLSYISIHYPRSFNFNQVDSLSFTLEDKGKSHYIEFENLEQDETYYVVDLTHQLKIQISYLEDKQIHAVSLPPSENEKRKLYFYKANKVKSIQNLTTHNFTNFNNLANQGDYLIITHPKLLHNNIAVDEYAAYRSSSVGGNYKPIVVNVEELYDLYSYGIANHPLAIKYFLNDALENWQNTPSHCFLMGKGLENRYARHKDDWEDNLIPAFGDQASDQIFGSADFSPLSRLAIGRLNADEPREIAHYLNKVKAVELPYSGKPCDYLKEQMWRHQIVHLADRDRIDTLGNPNPYNSRLLQQADIATNGILTAASTFLFIDEDERIENTCVSNNSNTQNRYIVDCLKEEVQQGVKIISYLGGAVGYDWGIDIGGPLSYNFNGQYPIIIGQDEFLGNIYRKVYDNTSTFFETEEEILLYKHWLNSKDAGGTAYISFNLQHDLFIGASFTDKLYRQMFVENPEATLGEQIKNVIHQFYNQNEFTAQYAAYTVILSGDPALKYYTQYKPEVILEEENVHFEFNHINDFYYNLSIQFSMASLNIPATQTVSYQIVQSSANKEVVIESGLLKTGETIYYKNDVVLLPDEAHRYTIQVDNINALDEICESNNAISFDAGAWLLNDIDEAISNNEALINYPNPFNDYTVFELTNHASNTASLQLNIMTLAGKLVKQHHFKHGASDLSFTWFGLDDLNNVLPVGVYWYYLKDVEQQTIGKPGKVVLVK